MKTEHMWKQAIIALIRRAELRMLLEFNVLFRMEDTLSLRKAAPLSNKLLRSKFSFLLSHVFIKLNLVNFAGKPLYLWCLCNRAIHMTIFSGLALMNLLPGIYYWDKGQRQQTLMSILLRQKQGEERESDQVDHPYKGKVIGPQQTQGGPHIIRLMPRWW